MSNIIPPLLSSTPPPIIDNFDEDEDDEFGDYRTAGDASFACDTPSIPPTPDFSPKKDFTPRLDINRNNKNEITNFDSDETKNLENLTCATRTCKEFQDEGESPKCVETSWNPQVNVNCDTPTQNLTNVDKIRVGKERIHKNNCDVKEVDRKVDLSSETSNELVNDCEGYYLSELTENVNTTDKTNESTDLTPDNFSDDIPPDTVHLKMTEDDNNLDFHRTSSVTCRSDHGNNQPEHNQSPESYATTIKFEGDFPVSSTIVYSECQINEDSKFGAFSDFSSTELPNYVNELTISMPVATEDVHIAKGLVIEKEISFPKAHKYDSDCISQKTDTEILTEKCDLLSQDMPNFPPTKDDYFDDFQNEIKYTEFKEVAKNDTQGSLDNAMNKPQIEDDDFDEFVACTDVSTTVNNEEIPSFTEVDSNKINDNCDNFADFSCVQITHIEENLNDDDFGDFESQTTTPSDCAKDEVVMLSINCENVLAKAENIVKIMFELVNREPVFGCDQIRLTENDRVFNQVKDITETKALSYQWANSSSQKSLLKALSIDESEILYGPSWNVSLPRFAANLSTSPLEPVKSDMSTTNMQTSNASSSSPCSVEVPTAQFDWSSSGLTNPLDYSQTMLLDLEHLVQTLDISGSLRTINSVEPVSSPVDELEEWDLWLKSKAAKEKSDNLSHKEQNSTIQEHSSIPVSQQEKPHYVAPVTSPSVLQPEVVSFSNSKATSFCEQSNNTQLLDLFKVPVVGDSSDTSQITCDDFEFTAFQSSSQKNWSVPLRETHISEPDKSPEDSDFVGWLQPTIVTPVLSRKNEPELQDDDFDDFQMVIPDGKKIGKPVEIFNKQPNESSCNIGNEGINFEQKTGTGEVNKVQKQEIQSKSSEVTNELSDFEDEEFTDFCSSIPNNVGSDTNEPVSQSSAFSSRPETKLESLLQPLQPVPLEPLKPINVYHPSPTKSTQINWPNPGITDEDLNNIDLSYSVKVPDSNIDKKMEEIVPKQSKDIEETQALGEDDWSDFVSVQDTFKHSLPSNKPERTSTPDLPLSVLNLGQVQPIKPPIPVITPKGLIQTQLPSSIPPLKVVQTSIANSSVNNMQHVNIRPSLITNQFLGQVYQSSSADLSTSGGNFISSLPNTSLPVNNSLHRTQHNVTSLKQTADDDDYWSDFVCSKPVQQSSGNSQHPKVSSSSSKPLHHGNGMFQNITPNIITNPSHFDAFRSYVPPSEVPRHSKANSNYSRKSALSSISAIPDLDFVAPKSRVSNRK